MRPKARTRSTTAFLSGLLIGSVAALIVGAVLIVGVLRNSNGLQQSPTIANVPPQGGDLAVPLIPVSTSQPTVGATPSRTVPPNTPTPVNLQPAIMITPASVSSVISGVVNLGVAQTLAVNSPHPMHAVSWSPLGDTLLYVTTSGELYSANSDGTNATLLRTFDPKLIWFMLDPQQPMTNSLVLPGYIAKFVAGQLPTLQVATDTADLTEVRWWSSNRASGIAGGPLVGGYVGGEKLVTVDANGQKTEERNIPYIVSGSVKPGGGWLAYSTDQQSTSTPFYGSSPETVYLLNLNTGQRLQITAAGDGHAVGNWSPDGNWFYMVARVANDRRGVLVSSDGRQRVVVTPPGYSGADSVFSPDSKRLAFSLQTGGCDGETSTSCLMTSDVYIVDVPALTVSDFSAGTPMGASASSSSMIMHPKWSPDGSKLVVLSFDPLCEGICSNVAPALYSITMKK